MSRWMGELVSEKNESISDSQWVTARVSIKKKLVNGWAVEYVCEYASEDVKSNDMHVTREYRATVYIWSTSALPCFLISI